MTDPYDHTVRSLAEILREHGLETDAGTRPGRGNRRRWDDPDDTGVQRRRAAPAEPPTDDVPVYGRRATDAPLPPAPEDGRGPSTAAIRGLRTSGKPGVPGSPRTADVPTGASTPAARDRVGERHERHERQGREERGREDRRREDRRRDDGRREDRRREDRRPAERPADDPPTGRVPRITEADLAEPPPAPQGALAWARFAGEMVAAVAVGVGVYFAFTALWELQAYVAVVASPAVVTGLVAGAQAWRHRQGRGPLEVRVLAVLLFTGTLLTIAPAGALLSGG